MQYKEAKCHVMSDPTSHSAESLFMGEMNKDMGSRYLPGLPFPPHFPSIGMAVYFTLVISIANYISAGSSEFSSPDERNLAKG